MKRGRVRVLHLFLMVHAVMNAVAVCRADDVPDTAREDRLRAGYLVNFAKFVDWPEAGMTDSFSVCFMGGDGIRSAFIAAAARSTIGNRPVAARSLSGRDSLAGCQILYVSAASPAAADYTARAAGGAMLTISDLQGFIHRGGIIELFTENNRLRFDISVDNARVAGLRISSSLLQLASHVDGNNR